MFKDTVIRHEFKFAVSYDNMDRLMDDLIPYTRSGEHVNKYGIYTVSSMYLDNDARKCYYETLGNDYFSQKIRLRVYGKQNTEDSDSYLEMKQKIDNRIIKRRAKMRLGDAKRFIAECVQQGTAANTDEFASSNDQILKEIKQVIVSENLKPVNIISYERLPLAGADDKDLRITFDFLLRTRAEEIDLAKGTHGEKRIPDKTALLEIKTEKPLPFWLVKLLSKYDYRDQLFSKYCSHYTPMRADTDTNAENYDRGDTRNVREIYKSGN